MASSKDLPDVGGFIRDLRRNAKISLRQLAEQAGVSNPYLSQIERGLRRPSAEVLQQLASALRVSTPAMYLRAGLLDDKEGQGVLAAVAVDPDLTMAQKQSLTQIYETFRRENARLAEATAAADAPATASAPQAPATATASAPQAPATVTPAATGPTTPEGTPTEAVLESVAVTEAGSPPAPRSNSPATKAAPQAADKTAAAVEEEKS
ncbi:helix-turn-helix domain-containing protein [Micromonospora sp. NBC_01405]|uniref:helix-turn-helix domain-containing protein n=1 Tax=Micromonospora sp. NBC_01405 TaxID=2903589 RepID=UPI003245FF09